MRSRAFAAAVLAFGTALSGCAATTTTSKVAVDYNRIFAKSRDEVLVTNILRASAREPLQFSTMGVVTGGVRNSGSLTIPLTNLIGGTTGLTISPSATLNDSINPNVNILPLGDKEFTAGILRPVTPETIDFFLRQGWDPEFVLMLTVGGVICPNGGTVLNRGVPDPGIDKSLVDSHFDDFTSMFSSAPRFPIKANGEPVITKIRMPAKDALVLFKDGVGKGRKIAGVETVEVKGRRTESVELSISKAPESVLTGLDTSSVCAGVKPRNEAEAVGPIEKVEITDENGKPQGHAVLRSVESMIYFLGETHRYRTTTGRDCLEASATDSWPFYKRVRKRANGEEVPQHITFLKLEKSCGKAPALSSTFLRTRFNGADYFIPTTREAIPSNSVSLCLKDDVAAECDRTLSTLGFLNELVALQISESSIASATPVIAIGAK